MTYSRTSIIIAQYFTSTSGQNIFGTCNLRKVPKQKGIKSPNIDSSIFVLAIFLNSLAYFLGFLETNFRLAIS